jgi:hypothetical protein
MFGAASMPTLKAATALGRAQESSAFIRNHVAAERLGGFIRQVLSRELRL